MKLPERALEPLMGRGVTRLELPPLPPRDRADDGYPFGEDVMAFDMTAGHVLRVGAEGGGGGWLAHIYEEQRGRGGEKRRGWVREQRVRLVAASGGGGRWSSGWISWETWVWLVGSW